MTAMLLPNDVRHTQAEASIIRDILTRVRNPFHNRYRKGTLDAAKQERIRRTAAFAKALDDWREGRTP